MFEETSSSIKNDGLMLLNVLVNSYGHVEAVASNFMGLLTNIAINDTQDLHYSSAQVNSLGIHEPHSEKTAFLHMRKQRRRSASR